MRGRGRCLSVYLNLGTIYYNLISTLTNLSKLLRAQKFQGSGVATPLEWLLKKLIAFFSAPGHPWKLFSWKWSSPVHPCWNQWCLDVHFNQPSSWSIFIFLLLIHIIIPFKDFLIFFFQRFSCFLPVLRNVIHLNWLRDFSLIKSVSIIIWITGNFQAHQEYGWFWTSSRHPSKVNDSW